MALLAGAATEAGAQRPGTPAAPRVSNLARSRDQLGLFAQQLVLPAGYCGPIHTHDGELHGFVTRGVLRVGLADTAGRFEVREYPAGSFAAVPAGRPHTEGSRGGTELYVSGFGPVVTAIQDSTATGRCEPGTASGEVTSAAAQRTSHLAGLVRDSAGAAVQGAQVIVGSSAVVASDSAGRFELPAVPAGRLAIHVRALGYYWMAFPSVRFAPGDTVRLDVRLVSLPDGGQECMVAGTCAPPPEITQ